MAFHILIQRSTPSLFKRFLFHFSGLFFTKNNSSFLSGTAVPSQLGTATGPPSEDPCPHSTVAGPYWPLSLTHYFHRDRKRIPPMYWNEMYWNEMY